MKMQFNSYLKYIALAIWASAITGCTDDETYNLDKIDESISMKYEMALPLIKSTFAIEDAYNEYNDDIKLKVDDDSLIYLEYSTNLSFQDLPEFEVSAIDYFSFKQSDADIDNPIILSSGTYEVSRTNNADLSAGTGGLDTVYISEGSLGINMQSGFVNNANIDEAFVILIESATKDGQPLTATFDPNESDTATLDVSGYTIKLQQEGGEEVLPIKVTYQLSSTTANSTTLEQEAWLKIGFSEGLSLNMVAAYLEEPILVEESLNIELSMFDDEYFDDDEIEFYDPKIFLDVKNYFSIPIYMSFDSAYFANPAANEKAPFDLSVNDTLSAAKVTGIGDSENFTITPSYQRIVLDKENTPDLPKLLMDIYSDLYLDATIKVDPKYSDPDNPIFFNPDSGSVDLTVIAHLPFWVKLSNISYEEDTEFDMSTVYDDAGEDSTNLENIEDAYLEIYIANSYAFETEAQCYLLDANNVVVDSVFSDGPTVMEAANSKESKEDIVSPTESTITIEITGDKIKKWRNVKTARIKFGASTKDEDFVKIYAGEEMSVSLALNIRRGYYEKEEF